MSSAIQKIECGRAVGRFGERARLVRHHLVRVGRWRIGLSGGCLDKDSGNAQQRGNEQSESNKPGGVSHRASSNQLSFSRGPSAILIDLTPGRNSPDSSDDELQTINSKRLIPVVGVPPDFLDVESHAEAQIDRSVFLAHAKALIVLEGLKRSAVVAHIVKAPLDRDEVLVNLWRRTPIPMILVARVGSGKPELGTKQINRAGFAVVAGPNAGRGAVVRWQRVVDAGDFIHHLGPSELVGNRLLQ